MRLPEMDLLRQRSLLPYAHGAMERTLRIAVATLSTVIRLMGSNPRRSMYRTQ